MITNQRAQFNLPDDVRYLNCAYMGPWTKQASEIIQEQTLVRQRPYLFTTPDFFDPVDQLKKSFASLIGVDDHLRIAPLTSVSYGMAQAMTNVKLNKGQKIIMIEDEFPSDVYAVKAAVERSGAELKVIKRPSPIDTWSENVLNAIDDSVGLVVMSQVHWADGYLFDLKSITTKIHHHGGLIVLDGTQSIGAFPFSIKEIPVDALITATYKWLLGPYGFSLGYFGEAFDGGKPIEDSWMNRIESDVFYKLTDYKSQYRPAAWRYSAGEQSNMLAIKLADASLQYIQSLTPGGIQEYTQSITAKSFGKLKENGFSVYDEQYRAQHLFGIHCPPNLNQQVLLKNLEEEKIFVSRRGEYIRVSPNVYNSAEEMDLLTDVLIRSL